MANRSYIYSYHSNEPICRDLGEWRSVVPPAHYLLVGINARPVRSEIWSVEEKVAVRGDGPEALKLFDRFLTWMEPQAGAMTEGLANYGTDDLIRDIKQTRATLSRDDRQGTHYHLEPGETYELAGYTLEEMEEYAAYDATTAIEIATEVQELLETAGSSFEDVKQLHLSDGSNGQDFGLYFAGILYFHLG